MPENKKLLFLSDTKEALDYIPKRAFSTTNYPKRTNPGQHADFIRRKIQECQTQSGASATKPRTGRRNPLQGRYVY